MNLRHTFAAALVALLGADAQANTPPPQLSIEDQICAATHVFIATASNLRFVNVSRVPMCSNEPPTLHGRLTSCGGAEADTLFQRLSIHQTGYLERVLCIDLAAACSQRPA
jgi:hypothetical protein